jgi:putative NADPH-quinone reductase
MQLWMEKVLVSGFAHSEGGTALAGKPCLWAVTTAAGNTKSAAYTITPSITSRRWWR